MDKNHSVNQSRINGDVAHIELWYPRSEDRVKMIQVGLVDVRAADDIRISYDFERDGWKIEQAAKSTWESGDEVCDPEWGEVAFIQAWSRDKGVSDSETA